jgi:ribosomal protein S18 acetylase RimI-like enzyme
MERDTWYANCIATDPPYQGRGLATAIVDHVLADAATTRSVVALGTQSEENVSVLSDL